MEKIKSILKIKNKKGWLRIVEAFIAVTLIAAVLLTALNEKSSVLSEEEKEELYRGRYEAQVSVLRKIQLNNSIRNEILGISDSNLPVNWSNMPSLIKTKIEKEKPIYFNCTAKICSLGSVCEMEKPIDKEIFVEDVGIFSNSTRYNPRKLKLFCWKK